MAKQLVLISIFLDGKNKLKKAGKVRNLKEIQTLGEKLHPGGDASLDRFMVYSTDFEEFIDVDDDHKVKAKNKYELYFVSSGSKKVSAAATTSDSGLSPATVGQLRAFPFLFNEQACLLNDELRNSSKIFTRGKLSKYRREMNALAHEIALKDPHLLQSKGELFHRAKEAFSKSKMKYLGPNANAESTVATEEVALSEHSYSVQTIDLGDSIPMIDPPDDEQESAQKVLQTCERADGEQPDNPSEMVSSLEALVGAMVENEGHLLDSSTAETQGHIDVDEVRQSSMIFGRNGNTNLTKYHIHINEMAFRIALKKPSLLRKKSQLFVEAKKLLHYSGYEYSRSNQTRSKLFQPLKPGGFQRRPYQTKKMRENRIAEIDIAIGSVKEQVMLITTEKSKLVRSEWNERAAHLEDNICELQKKINSLEMEKRQMQQREQILCRRQIVAAKWKEKQKTTELGCKEECHATQLLESMTSQETMDSE